jgi:hypothetical protein
MGETSETAALRQSEILGSLLLNRDEGFVTKVPALRTAGHQVAKWIRTRANGRQMLGFDGWQKFHHAAGSCGKRFLESPHDPGFCQTVEQGLIHGQSRRYLENPYIWTLPVPVPSPACCISCLVLVIPPASQSNSPLTSRRNYSQDALQMSLLTKPSRR